MGTDAHMQGSWHLGFDGRVAKLDGAKVAKERGGANMVTRQGKRLGCCALINGRRPKLQREAGLGWAKA